MRKVIINVATETLVILRQQWLHSFKNRQHMEGDRRAGVKRLHPLSNWEIGLNKIPLDFHFFFLSHACTNAQMPERL